MLSYQAPTTVDLLSNSHSDSTIPSESSRSIPVPPAASSVQPTNSKPVPVAPINGRTNPPVFDSTPDDSHCEFKTVELGEKYPYSLSSHVDLSVCIVLIVVWMSKRMWSRGSRNLFIQSNSVLMRGPCCSTTIIPTHGVALECSPFRFHNTPRVHSCPLCNAALGEEGSEVRVLIQLFSVSCIYALQTL